MKATTTSLFALFFSLFVLTTSCSSDSESLTPTAETQKSYTHDAEEIKMLDLINTYRVEHNLNALEIIEHISYKSNEHNAYMISVQNANHDGFDSRKTNLQQVLGAVRVGENVAYGFSSSQSALNAWVASTLHKANLEGNYTHYGVSIKTGADGKKYYTNMFIKK